MIEVRGLGHAYGAKRVLSDVSLSVPAGCVMGLVGPNSAGKTTLIRSIATLLAPAEGTVHVDGHDARAAAAGVRRALGYLPERTPVFPDLRVWEYLDLFAELAGVGPAAARRRRVDGALARAGLEDRRELLARELSKGMAQRLALAGALMHDPTTLVLDEPTDGLDPESRELFLADVRGLADGGAAVLLSSHVLAEVEAVADDVTILVAGRVMRERAEDPAEPARFWARVRGDVQAACRALAGAPGLAGAAVDGDRLLLDLAPGEADASAAAAALVRAGFALVELGADRDSLRRRFLRAVDRGKDALPS